MRNERDHIGATIEAVASQHLRPVKWVLVSDGSSDGSDDIVQSYAERLAFLGFARLATAGVRSFASKVTAFNYGYSLLGEVNYQFIGNLDGDVTFAPDYFDGVVNELLADRAIGIGGGMIYELIDGRYRSQNSSRTSVAGAVQLFRRECFAAIGGYTPSRLGGVDSIAEIKARALGWGVRCYADFRVLHHRPVGGLGSSLVRTRYRQGMLHRQLGYHPLFELLRCVFTVVEHPRVLGSACTAAGYLRGVSRGSPALLEHRVKRFLRREQLRRVSSFALQRREI